LRYGGHRAAAGLEIEAGALETFPRAFCERTAATLGPEPAPPREGIDAGGGCESLGLEGAEQLDRLGALRAGDPPGQTLLPGARLADVRPMGSGERHARFPLASGPRRALGVAFGVNGGLAATAAAERLDVSVGLEVNQWNGALEPRVVLGTVYPPDSPAAGELARPGDEEWWGRVDAELAAPLDRWPRLPEPPGGDEGCRETIDRRGHGAVAGARAPARGRGGGPGGRLRRAAAPRARRAGGGAGAVRRRPGRGRLPPARHRLRDGRRRGGARGGRGRPRRLGRPRRRPRARRPVRARRGRR